MRTEALKRAQNKYNASKSATRIDKQRQRRKESPPCYKREIALKRFRRHRAKFHADPHAYQSTAVTAALIVSLLSVPKLDGHGYRLKEITLATGYTLPRVWAGLQRLARMGGLIRNKYGYFPG